MFNIMMSLCTEREMVRGAISKPKQTKKASYCVLKRKTMRKNLNGPEKKEKKILMMIMMDVD